MLELMAFASIGMLAVVICTTIGSLRRKEIARMHALEMSFLSVHAIQKNRRSK